MVLEIKNHKIFSLRWEFSGYFNFASQNSSTIITSGASLNIVATNTGGNASYNLKSNGASINTNSATANYSYNHTNITLIKIMNLK
jgi:hypothetical protein